MKTVHARLASAPAIRSSVRPAGTIVSASRRRLGVGGESVGHLSDPS